MIHEVAGFSVVRTVGMVTRVEGLRYAETVYKPFDSLISYLGSVDSGNTRSLDSEITGVER